MLFNYAPFTAHISVVPKRGKRFETVRALHRLARLVYEGLTPSSKLTLANPGGGMAAAFDGAVTSDFQNGCAVKPQFGESPAQLMITGFYSGTGTSGVAAGSTWPDKTVAHVGSYVTGPGGSHGWDANPNTTVATEVKALKAIIDAAIAAQIPGEGATTFRIDYKGVIFGDRGHHFPI